MYKNIYLYIYYSITLLYYIILYYNIFHCIIFYYIIINIYIWYNMYIYIWYNRRSIAFNSPRTKHPLIVLLKVYIIHSSSTNCFFCIIHVFFWKQLRISFLATRGLADWNGDRLKHTIVCQMQARSSGCRKRSVDDQKIHFFVWTRIFKKGNGLEGTICIYENIEMMCHISIYVINGVSVCNIYMHFI